MRVCVGLAEDFLRDYIQVNIGSLDLCANHNILQIIEMCEEYEKDGKWERISEYLLLVTILSLSLSPLFSTSLSCNLLFLFSLQKNEQVTGEYNEPEGQQG